MSEMSERPRAIIILEALLQGHTLDVGGRSIVLATDEDGDKKLAMIAERFRGGAPIEPGKGEKVLLPYSMSFDGFLRWCAEMTDEEFKDISADVALTKARRARLV